MDLTPSQITGASFDTVRKGFDPDQVNAFLEVAASALEAAQQQATSMEARARAAVARLQERNASTEQPKPSADSAASDDAETISRTLLLAQRTADTTVAEARVEADRLLAEARAESEATLDSTRESSAQLLEEARSEARKATEAERETAANEVQELAARRDFLSGDVETLEQFVAEQRERVRAVSAELAALADRPGDGLGSAARPVLSAAGEVPLDSTAEIDRPDTVDVGDGDGGPDPADATDEDRDTTDDTDDTGDTDAASATDGETPEVDPTPRAATPPSDPADNPPQN